VARKPLGFRSRTNILFGVVLVFYGLLTVRLLQIQVIGRNHYQAMADRYHVRSITLPAHRGQIRDRNGELLAINSDAASVSVDPSFYWDQDKWATVRKGGKRVKVAPDKDAAARAIAEVLGMQYADVRPKLDRKTKYVALKRRVTLDTARRLQAAEIPGLRIDDELKRMYPMGSLAAHVLGGTGSDGTGLGGLEMKFNSILARKDGVEVQEVDRKGRIIPGTLRSEREPQDGANIVLTIDTRIQQVAERELAKACETYKAVGGTATVMDPNTGEILALANYPRYDPNRMGDYPPDAWRNRAVTDLYEPGSTMKALVAAAALNENVVNLTQRFSCPGYLKLGTHTVHDIYEGPGSFGMLNLGEILMHSSNVGMSHVGLRLGRDKLDEYVRAFGLLGDSGVELPGEPRAWLPATSKWDKHFTATISFGQSVNFTALRLATAYSAIANGGTLMRPHIVKRIEWPESSRRPGEVEEAKPDAVRRVISEQTARSITELLKGVVEDGTGKPAKVRGYDLVGKTGSAQKVIPGKGYSKDKFIGSFIGFLPANKPRAVILVTIDEPKGSHWGATTAAPVFREVARQAVWYLRIPPDNPNDRFDGSDRSTWYRRTARG
jgi:cell division protein FtsI (penicillin-binding protein 3)